MATPDAKRALHRDTGAVAADTESHTVAGAAAHHGLPMVAIRVVCDPVTRTLPDVALRAVRPDGSTDVAALLRSVLRRPYKVPELLRIALDARSAHATLSQCCRVLGPDLGLARVSRLRGDPLEAVQPSLGPVVG